MTIIVDTNSVFSAMLNPESKHGQILINGSKYFNFFTTYLLKDEIDRHENKILKLSKLERKDYIKIYEILTARIKFINNQLISNSNIEAARELTKGIDENDTLFIAMALEFSSKLWTGDKKLINGLNTKGFTQFITTDELFRLYLEKEYRKSSKRK